MKRLIQNKRQYNVISIPEFANSKDIDKARSVVEVGDYVYPIKPSHSRAMGVYHVSSGLIGVDINDDIKEEFSASPDNPNLIDLNHPKNYKDVVDKANKYREAERSILTSPENITVLRIDEEDSGEMLALKTAINEKIIDINNYQDRFGPNASNNLRILNQHSISLNKLKEYAKVLDLKLTLTIEDSNADIANPMNKKIIVDLMNGQGGIYDNKSK